MTDPLAVVRFRPQRILLVVAVMYLGIGGAATYIAVLATGSGGEYVVTAIAATFALAALAGAGAVARIALGRVVLLAGALRAPTVFGRRVVPLSDIAGIGLRYASAGRGSGWRTYVWPADGKRIRLYLVPPAFSAPKDKRTYRRPGPGVAPPLDWNYVAQSPAGRAAIGIARRVEQLQGPHGAWLTSRREARPVSGQPDTAYWSPFGDTGVLPGARPASQPR